MATVSAHAAKDLRGAECSQFHRRKILGCAQLSCMYVSFSNTTASIWTSATPTTAWEFKLEPMYCKTLGVYPFVAVLLCMQSYDAWHVFVKKTTERVCIMRPVFLFKLKYRLRSSITHLYLYTKMFMGSKHINKDLFYLQNKIVACDLYISEASLIGVVCILLSYVYFPSYTIYGRRREFISKSSVSG